METVGLLNLQASGWTGFGNARTDVSRLALQREAPGKEVFAQKFGYGDSRLNFVARPKKFEKVFCSCKNSGVSALEQGNINVLADESLILKKEAQKLIPSLSGQSIYLVGMMGSGKTTVAKILAEVLDYTFLDCDSLIEKAAGATSVAQIFEEHSEDFFRHNESMVLKDLSTMQRLVVATGGGAVIRPINWKYMKKGVTVWLDVPLEALARRIAAVGTASRPLLHQESGDAYTLAFRRLGTLFEERGHAYENADVRVSLQRIAVHKDVNKLTPAAIAIEALIRINHLFTKTQYAERISSDTV